MTPFGVSGIRTRVLCRGMEVVAVSAFCLPAMLRYHTRGCVSRKKSCERSGRKNFFSAESPGPARPRTPRQGIYPLHPDPAMGPVINNKLYPPVWQCRQVSSRAKENERNAAGKRLWAFPPRHFTHFPGAFHAPRATASPARERLRASKDRGSREVTSLVQGFGG